MKLLDRSIYDGIEQLGLSTDLQGWHSTHAIFERLIRETKARSLLDVGSWKGASAIHMVKTAQRLAEEAGDSEWLHAINLLAIDTWLGSLEHVLRPTAPGNAIPKRHGYPQLYFQFLHNVKDSGLHERITPLPMTSGVAAALLTQLQRTADLVYVDASHEYSDVLDDLDRYWARTAPGGIMFGDDYDWLGVRRAVSQFGVYTNVPAEIVDNLFWIMRKPKLPNHE